MEDIDKDRVNAEVFDALGHPTRIVILKTLSKEPLGFAELKKKLGIDSSGHLQHHLNKLGNLIKTNEYGKYCLSDQGKDALFMIKIVEGVSEPKIKETRIYAINRWKMVAVTMVVALILSTPLAYFCLTIYHEKNEMLSSLNGLSFNYLMSIKGDIDTLLFLLEYNNNTDIIICEARALSYSSKTLYYITRNLYHHTGNSKCYNMSVIFFDLFAFINDVSNDEPSKIVPEFAKNKEIFVEIRDRVKEMAIYEGVMEIPNTLIGELRTAVGKLSK
ncbi:winged helix-turn-helix transcriptional regulator [Candidatus Bathyarchaeota archaeon]|nr:winged helix-turn-helix transcriptional regulator [Candidatus Bathyarchaeota archaeon]